jgi:putative Ca2+/H+ antiporter (TMEM165/GDT1 family)
MAGRLPPQIATPAMAAARASPQVYWTGRLIGFILISGA